jgi:DNA polymerase I-like protein with 3'-5' exonuclease and polymerase domains
MTKAAPAGAADAAAAAQHVAGEAAAAAADTAAALASLPEGLSMQLTDVLAEMLSQGVEVNVQHVLALLSQLPQQSL